jgi:NodT family efflux transporter outer membrane factor (OMF) lipoprotein
MRGIIEPCVKCVTAPTIFDLQSIIVTMRVWGVASFLMLASFGCASVVPPRAPSANVEVPAAWSAGDRAAADGSPVLAEWWLRFEDPLLARLIAQALKSNKTLANATAALRQARALRDASRAALFPVLNASAAAQRGSNSYPTVSNDFSAGLDASWELDIFGANRSALYVSDALVKASVASLGDAQVSVAAEVALDYITLRDAQARLAIATENLANQENTLQIARWRQQAGLSTLLETEQARAETEQTRAQLPLLHTVIEQFSHATAVLTGQPPRALSSVLTEAAPVPRADSRLALGIPADTLRQRPDVRYAEHQVRAAMARVSQAKAARAPDFALGGSLTSSALSVGALGSSASIVKAIVASVAMPLFDAGARRAQVRAQVAALEQAQAAYEASILLALQEVEDALVAIRGDGDRTRSLRKAAEAAANASLMARQLFSSGLTDFLTVLDTQRAQLSTQDALASAIADVSSDHVRLYKALGGGWTSAEAADSRPSAQTLSGLGR